MRRGYSTRKVSDSKNERAEGEISSNVFECPPDFEEGAYIPLGGLTVESAKASSTEVWLIQAPTDFSPQCLAGMMIPLEGFERVTLDKENKHYRIMSSCQGMPKTGVVLPVEKGGDRLQWAPVLKGMISVTEEAVGMANGSGKIHPVPVPPPPRIPEGLRQRFKPFGYSQPAGAQGHIADRKETTRKKRKLAAGPELVVKDEPNRSKRAKGDKKSREKSRDETVPAAPLAVQVKVEPEKGHGKAHGRKKKNREKNQEVAAPAVVDGSNLAVQVKEEGAEERNGNEASPEAATRSGGTESPLLCLQDAVGESEEGVKEEVKPKKKKKKSKKDRKEEAPLAAVEISELSEGVCAAVKIEQGSTESRSRKKKKKSRDKEKTAMGEGVCAADLIINEAYDGVEVKTEMESWDLIREEAASPSAYSCVVPKVEAEQNEPSVRRKKKKRRDKDADDADDAGGEGHVAAGTTSSRSTVAGDAGAADVKVADIAVDDTELYPVKREDEKEARKKKQKKKKKEEETEKHVAVKREEPPSDAAAVDEHALRKRSKHKQSEEEIPNADVGERAHKKTKKKKKK
ncbi:DNA-directed RNA polymerase I subunit RPA34 [Petromyzon marinus]|uniref:DNA-directed RNA polymerase I subunit RPA34 n=1 Tax=Petromyzon marinus TaxID=7757 RepID=UPI003F72458E